MNLHHISGRSLLDVPCKQRIWTLAFAFGSRTRKLGLRARRIGTYKVGDEDRDQNTAATSGRSGDNDDDDHRCCVVIDLIALSTVPRPGLGPTVCAAQECRSVLVRGSTETTTLTLGIALGLWIG